MKEKIMQIIESDPETKQIYDTNGDCFKNVILPIIETYDDEEEAFKHIVFTLVSLAAAYDSLINNIAQSNDPELIIKCNNDINAIYSCEDNVEQYTVSDTTESISEEDKPVEE